MNDAVFSRVSYPLHIAVLSLVFSWILYRILCLLRIRTKALSQKLGLGAPPKPIVIIEQLSENQAKIRWHHNEFKGTLRYSLQLDDNFVEIEKGSHFAVLEGLAPSTLYTVCVAAIGSNERQSRTAVQFRTLSHAKHRAPLKIRSNIEVRKAAALKSSNADGQTDPKTTIKTVQLEIANIVGQQQQITAEFEAEKAKLQLKLENMNQERRRADQSRAQQRAEAKTLEETRRTLDLAMAKAKSNHAEVQQLLNAQHSTQNRWTTEIEQWQRAQDLLEESKEEVIRKHALDLSALEERKTQLIEENAAMEKWALDQAAVNSAARSSHAEITSRLEQLRKHTDLATGEVPQEILKQVTADIADSAVIDYLVADFAQDASQERQWVETQKLRESQYVEAYLKYEEAARKLREATAQAQAHAKAQAHRASASIASSGSSRSLSSMAPTSSSFSAVFSPTGRTRNSGISLSPATSTQTADYQFDSPALHSWLAPRGSLESSRASSIFFGPPASESQDLQISQVNLDPMAESQISDEDPSEENTDTSTDTRSPRKKKLFFTLEPSNGRSFVRRLSFFPKKDEKRFDHIEEADELSVTD